jgi:polyphosphate kinase
MAITSNLSVATLTYKMEENVNSPYVAEKNPENSEQMTKQIETATSSQNQVEAVKASIHPKLKTKAGEKPTDPPPVPPTVDADTAKPECDLTSSEWYLNRELTWLSFNRRVLNEAEDPRTPLLERIKFIAIVSANLDEFFMKRIGGLKQQIGAEVRETSLDGRNPRQQVEECHAVIRELEARKEEVFRQISALLENKNIVIERYQELLAKEKKQLRDHYHKNIFPLLTPQSIDPAHPFPFISNLSLNLLVSLRYPKSKEISLARGKAPGGSVTPR